MVHNSSFPPLTIFAVMVYTDNQSHQVLENTDAGQYILEGLHFS